MSEHPSSEQECPCRIMGALLANEGVSAYTCVVCGAKYVRNVAPPPSKQMSLFEVVRWLRVQGGKFDGPNMYDQAADVLIGKADVANGEQS